VPTAPTVTFRDCLEESWRYADAPWWEHVYREAFPGFSSMADCRQDGTGQRDGIDRKVNLCNGKTIDIDEKVRKKYYPDVLLEYDHKWPSYNKPGWIAREDMRCDYIAYAWVPKRTCILLPWPALRRAWLAHGEAWKAKGLGPRKDRDGFRADSTDLGNLGYRTYFVCVPLPVISRAIQEAFICRWSATIPSGGVPYDNNSVPLPLARPSKAELVAAWDAWE